MSKITFISVKKGKPEGVEKEIREILPSPNVFSNPYLDQRKRYDMIIKALDSLFHRKMAEGMEKMLPAKDMPLDKKPGCEDVVTYEQGLMSLGWKICRAEIKKKITQLRKGGSNV